MARDPHRFRLHRAGVLNVWQYDEQVFDFADGRLLLRGTNGAGKSKTLEMLLPFVLDGDKARMTATGRQGSQLLWLMTDGATGGGTRTGYLWVELARTDEAGEQHVVTCGIGIRHSASARSVTTWQFTVPTPVPALAEPDGTPLSAPRCREVVAELGGQSFDTPRAYKEHVGQLLFGLEPRAYDDLLRLLYWLRQPQVGEDLDPRRLVEMLDEALPALDEDAVRQVGETFDELAEHGERVERLAAAARAVEASAGVYGRYAAGVVRERAAAARDAERERAVRSRALGQARAELDRITEELGAARTAQQTSSAAHGAARSRVQVLESGPLARNQQVLQEKQRRAQALAQAAERARNGARHAADRAHSSRSRVDREGRALAEAGDRLHAGTAAVRDALSACALASGLATAGDAVEQAGLLRDGVPDVRSQATAARAAAGVVRAALDVVDNRTRARDAAAERAAEAERREEQAAGRAADADRDVASAEGAWLGVATAWGAERGLAIETPSPQVLHALPVQARDAVAGEQQQLREREASAAAARVAAERLLAELAAQRERVLAEKDPSPAPPALARPGRDPAAGLPLWRLVDVREGTVAAPLEAALQASGLLDAQVLADGGLRLLDDTVLGVDGLGVDEPPEAVGTSLADALRPDVPEGSPVGAEVVARLLAGIALSDTAAAPWSVGRDGSWRLGPLTGRASKPVAQYVGSAARAAERARRLAEVDQRQQAATADHDEAAGAESSAAAGLTAIGHWLDRLPSTGELTSTWVLQQERARALDRARVDASERAGQLLRATAELARVTGELRRLCSEHALPGDREALQARNDALRDLDSRLESLAAEAGRLLTAARRHEEDGEEAERDAAEAERTQVEAADAAEQAEQAEQESAALLETLGADVQRMQAELTAAQHDQREAARARDQAGQQVLALTGQHGAADAQVRAADQRLADAQPEVAERLDGVLGLRAVPGLLAAALEREPSEDELAGLDALAGAVAGASSPLAGTSAGPLPRVAGQLLAGWAELPAVAADANAVYRDVATLAAGPAADQEPRVVTVGAELMVLARDAAGAEQPLAVAAARLAAEVVRERELLTDRERTLFEEHLLGELGDALRSRQAEATDLVAGMNELLSDVRTSQGIRVRLDWALREDVGADVAAAVALLGRPRGSLTPDEGGRLRAALSGLIEVQRAAEPEHGYAEHLARALDYRRWSAFTVRLHRPGVQSWTTLARRTPLSQGEQKVVCYLPLFAAAAAHFTSVAGAAPYAPRLILLDDAFPKIDVRTHPLLFGLLVDLDLDFVLTSERLWGDHPSVPSLAVYEALRAPGERGIAQYRYTWDGRVLVGHG